MGERDFEKLIGDDFALPAAPLVAQRVLDVTADENSSAKDLVKVIGPDSGITSRILKVANSSFYGRTSEVSTLVLAVSTMGFDAGTGKVLWRDGPMIHAGSAPVRWVHGGT